MALFLYTACVSVSDGSFPIHSMCIASEVIIYQVYLHFHSIKSTLARQSLTNLSENSSEEVCFGEKPILDQLFFLEEIQWRDSDCAKYINIRSLPIYLRTHHLMNENLHLQELLQMAKTIYKGQSK
eukprot:TRINITY_DN85064_c0_g1_i1.p1 TRINITY_DN85064_c0_g1~~TRINITY_DN85064_c0_g1_i1.p1  ORF type:complete len:126 (+),score=3.99 TRINITY_DN85064_c0_g1_i1:33-410(+)